MAHTQPFDRSYSNPASRLVYQRPWLLVLAVLAIFAFYVFSGNYSFTRPFVVEQAARAGQQTAPAVSEDAAGLTSETSSTSFSAQTNAIIATSSGESHVAEQTSAPVQQTSATQPTSQAAALPQAASNAAQTAPLAGTLTTSTAAERWATAGIILEAEGQAWDESSLTNVDSALSLLPPAVLARLGNPALGPLHILVNTEGRSLSGSQPYGGAANYFSTNDGVNELVLYPGQSVKTVLHEMGHAYNLRATPAGHYAQVLIDPEMASFLDATGWRVLTPRATVATAVDHTQVDFDYEGTFAWPEVSHFDPLEDYANTFAMYYADPSGLRTASPERYGWMSANLPK